MDYINMLARDVRPKPWLCSGIYKAGTELGDGELDGSTPSSSRRQGRAPRQPMPRHPGHCNLPAFMCWPMRFCKNADQ